MNANNRNRAQSAKLTGRFEVDAGLVRYRELLNAPQHGAKERRSITSVASLLLGPFRPRGPQAAPAVANVKEIRYGTS
ncbi:MAG: hypothetical protein JSW65_05320 [Candidatus Bipolaricaulota bacterium]|nr:MAG: hypothetical protein JSW65_05320 [Candidatus Bipolaricaulota bacterium]